MKGIVLAILALITGVVSSFGGTTDFGALRTGSFLRDPAVNLRTPATQRTSAGQWITDAQSERRGSRPIMAYTLFRFDSKYGEVAVQPVLGRINGGQLHLTF